MHNKLTIVVCILWITIFMAGCDILDRDDDGIAGHKDNCPSVANPDQRDYDGDGKGDVCDRDRDGDGLKDGIDACISLDPDSFGSCEMLLGVAFNGESCVYTSGCSCEPDCGLIFPDLESCEQACTVSKPVGMLVSHTDCKPPVADGRKTSSDQECIEYAYADGVLRINHINAGYNCCLDEIAAQIKIEDRMIAIAEDDALTQPCKCLCLYDVAYEISNLAPDVYSVEISGDNSIRTQADLINDPVDIYCEKRTSYPWGN